MKGSDSSDANAQYKKQLTDRIQYHLDYLSLPVLASWHFGYHKIHYLDLGPYAAVLLSGKMAFNGSTTDAGFKGFDTGTYFAFGTKFPIKDNIKIFGEIRGMNSFADFRKNVIGNGYRTGVIAFAFGLNF